MQRREFLKTAGLAAAVPTMNLGLAAENESANRSVNPSTASSASFRAASAPKLRNRDRSTVVSQEGMVCASQPLAAMAGIRVLQAGGSCVDAAIAANAVLGVTEPASNGIGGDLFALIWIEADRTLYGLNSSGRSPATWNLSQAEQRHLREIPRVSPLSWTVPGCVRGWEALHQRWGKSRWADCFATAIHYAQDGFPLSPLIADHFRLAKEAHSSLAEVYRPSGHTLAFGDIFHNPLLARSLESIANEGADAFYRGRIAEQLVAKSKELGGFMELEDLAQHQADWVSPISTNYRGWDLWQLPPNGQGMCVLQMMNLLETFDIPSLERNSAEHLHLFIEAKRLVYEDRARYYADPQFSNVPVEWLISKEYAKQRAALIDRNTARSNVGPGDPPLDSDTIYLTAADRDGNMISLIQSLYNGFGSTICPDDVGFSIQNRGQAFSLDPQHANRLEGRKRPFHTIIPGFVTQNGHPKLAFGVMGGDFQPQGHCQVLMHMLDFGLSPQEAGDQPRLSHVGSTDPWASISRPVSEIVLEPGFDASVIESLSKRGHLVARRQEIHGGYQAIWREDEPRRYFGGSDPRKDGAAIGY